MTHPMLDLSAWNAANDDDSLIIADGKGVYINVHGQYRDDATRQVNGGVLVIKDGPMGETRIREIARVPRTVKHLAILTNNGSFSLNAMSWLKDCEITWAVIDRSGRTPRRLGTSEGYINPDYVTQQVLCRPGMPNASVGVKIVRYLITEKLQGQADNAELVLRSPSAAAFIRSQIPAVARARSVETIRGIEGAAADEYWGVWRGRILEWKRPYPADEHWIVYPSRHSLRYTWETNRNATDPVNALLNFGYHCAEIECSLACYAASLSPAMGIGHATRGGRDSFALDLIEIMRPRVDRIILDILSKPLDKRWFRADRQGVVMCTSPLTHKVVSAVHKEATHITRTLFTVVALLGITKPKAQLKAVT